MLTCLWCVCWTGEKSLPFNLPKFNSMADECCVTDSAGGLSHSFNCPGPPSVPGPPNVPGPPSGLAASAGGLPASWKSVPVSQPPSTVPAVTYGQDHVVDVGRLAANMQVRDTTLLLFLENLETWLSQDIQRWLGKRRRESKKQKLAEKHCSIYSQYSACYFHFSYNVFKMSRSFANCSWNSAMSFCRYHKLGNTVITSTFTSRRMQATYSCPQALETRVQFLGFAERCSNWKHSLSVTQKESVFSVCLKSFV